MDFKKMFVFWERSLVSGFTVGVAASLLLIFLLVSFDNHSVTQFPSSSSATHSLFSFFKNRSSSSSPNLTDNISSNSLNNTFSEGPLKHKRIGGGNETASWPISSNVSVHESNLGEKYTGKLNLSNSDVSNSSLTQENLPLEKVIGGNLACNNNSSSTGSSCNSTESDLGSKIGGNMTQSEKNSNGSVHSNAISTGITEIVDTRNLTINATHEIGTKIENANSSSHNLVAESNYGNLTLESGAKISNNSEKTDNWNTSSTQENISIQNPQIRNSFQNETHVDNDTNMVVFSDEKCDIFDGKWVRDESYPLFPPGSCPYIDDDFNCYKNGRPDDQFLKWRWQPNRCNIPRLNATDFLERLRGKRLLFVGDSLNRNMWESLVCILRNAVRDKSRVFEVSGKKRFKSKTSGYYSFRFKDYKCYVDFVRSTFLVKEFYTKNNGIEDEKLRLDLLDETTVAYQKADIIIFNTGHWWTHEKTSEGINYYQEGNYVYPVLKVLKAYKKALTTWARWVDKNINPTKTQVVFRGYSLTHFRGGQWNSGGQCNKETEPIFNESFLSHYPSKMRALERVLRGMKTPVLYLNISRLTDYRKDAHPSVYRKKYNSLEEQIKEEKSQDCSHWCLPGVPDLWNEVLYVSLLKAGKGSWRN
ncbi:hypothetical protein LUZ60_012878 [Juncus effusus]|nr:hypothetical protein LUZ60_012878 [Juncus effusus]